MDNLETLALRAAKGDKAAFEQIYRETYRSVYFTCISFLKSESDAKDMVQDTYLTAMEKLESLDDKSKLASWLNRIAVNKCKVAFCFVFAYSAVNTVCGKSFCSTNAAVPI